MEDGLRIKNGLFIPLSELDIAASRSGGAGGQHVNKTNTRITVRWNVSTTKVLSEQQKERILQKLATRLTNEGDLVIHSGGLRSQQQNRENALAVLSDLVRRALHVPKKRIKTKVPRSAKEGRLQTKSRRAQVKKLRQIKE